MDNVVEVGNGCRGRVLRRLGGSGEICQPRVEIHRRHKLIKSDLKTLQYLLQ